MRIKVNTRMLKSGESEAAVEDELEKQGCAVIGFKEEYAQEQGAFSGPRYQGTSVAWIDAYSIVEAAAALSPEDWERIHDHTGMHSHDVKRIAALAYEATR